MALPLGIIPSNLFQLYFHFLNCKFAKMENSRCTIPANIRELYVSMLQTSEENKKGEIRHLDMRHEATFAKLLIL